MRAILLLIIGSFAIGCRSQSKPNYIYTDSGIISRTIMFSDSGNEIYIDDSSHTHINGDTAKVFKAMFKYWMQLQRKADSLQKIIDSLTHDKEIIYAMELHKALNIAGQVVNALAPHCDIINIGGSCRREKPEVKDIEIVALPKVIVAKDLFGGDMKPARSLEFEEAVIKLGRSLKGKPGGRYTQVLLRTSEGEINLDLFMPEAADYYRQFAIRTGSADWTARFIAGGWVKQGWCGTDVGLRKQDECHGERGPDHKMHWKCIRSTSEQTLPPHWKSEEEFFEWLQLKWIHPKYREL